MIRAGFLSREDRKDLIALARDGSAAHRLARRANALVLLDAGWNCARVAVALLVDDDTIRAWHNLFAEHGLDGLASFEAGGSACQFSDERQQALKTWISASLPRSTRQIGAWIMAQYGLVYDSRSGLIALLHRLGLEYHKPKVIPRRLDEKSRKPSSLFTKTSAITCPTMKPCCLPTRCIRPMPPGPPAAGRRSGKRWQSSRQADASASIFTARLIWKPAKPAWLKP